MMTALKKKSAKNKKATKPKTARKIKNEKAAPVVANDSGPRKITHEILKSWSPCLDGYKRFCQLFPEGADLDTASVGLTLDGHENWAQWLWQKCAANDDFKDQTVKTAGYRGTASAGDRGTASAGEEGFITIMYWSYKKEKCLRKVGAIDGESLKPGVKYKLDDFANFIALTAAEIAAHDEAVAALQAENKALREQP